LLRVPALGVGGAGGHAGTALGTAVRGRWRRKIRKRIVQIKAKRHALHGQNQEVEGEALPGLSVIPLIAKAVPVAGVLIFQWLGSEALSASSKFCRVCDNRCGSIETALSLLLQSLQAGDQTLKFPYVLLT
jgi:hypothetical protein